MELELDAGFPHCDGASAIQAIRLAVWSWLVEVVEAVFPEAEG